MKFCCAAAANSTHQCATHFNVWVTAVRKRETGQKKYNNIKKMESSTLLGLQLIYLSTDSYNLPHLTVLKYRFLNWETPREHNKIPMKGEGKMRNFQVERSKTHRDLNLTLLNQGLKQFPKYWEDTTEIKIKPVFVTSMKGNREWRKSPLFNHPGRKKIKLGGKLDSTCN